MIVANFNILNQKGSPAVLSDVAANRPTAGYTGRLFVATDTKVLQRDNGSSYDTIGDNSLLGATNGLTLSGNDVKLGGTLIENTSISGSYGLGLGATGNATHKFYIYDNRTIFDGSAGLLVQRNFVLSSDLSTQNIYGSVGTLIADLSSGKINGANSYNAAALQGSLVISNNNGQSTRAIRSIQAVVNLTDVNLAEVRLIAAKAPELSGTNTITNVYGLHIDSMKSGSVSTAYGVYQQGVNDANYFFGTVYFENNFYASLQTDGLIGWIRRVGATKNVGFFFRTDETSGAGTLNFSGSTGYYGVIKTGSVENVYFVSDGTTQFLNDVKVTDSSKGFVLKSPNGTNYRISVDNSGVLSTAAI